MAGGGAAPTIELPLARKQRFIRDYQLPAGDAEVFKSDVALGNYFERLARQSKNPKAVANWVINNLLASSPRPTNAKKASKPRSVWSPPTCNSPR